MAQYFFAALYLLQLAAMHIIYRRCMTHSVGRKGLVMPPWTLILLSLSKRYHSIFVLRLFNDPVAMLMLSFSLVCILSRRWWLASAFLSLGVSVKMNILLFLPAYGLLLLRLRGTAETLMHVLFMLGIQFSLAWPFLSRYPQSYLGRAFEFSRVFLYKWTVNWKCVPEWVFLHPGWHRALLVSMVSVMLVFAHRRFLMEEGGLLEFVKKRALHWGPPSSKTTTASLTDRRIIWILFTVNFIGIVFARSLHYQFYSWYFCSLPLLLWHAHILPTSMPPWVQHAIRVVLFFTIEVCWNVYPAKPWSSGLLLLCHTWLLLGLWLYRFNDDDGSKKKTK